MTGSERPTNHLRGLRNVYAPLRFHSATELHIGQLRIVPQLLLGGLGQRRDRLDRVDAFSALGNLLGGQLLGASTHARLKAENRPEEVTVRAKSMS